MIKKRILIVEDEIIIARELEARLIGMGYDVAGIAVSGMDAIARFAETQPDLVLMDVNLKGDMDGIEAAEKIRKDVSVPIIFLTAFADEQTLARARRSEPYGYIVKPFVERELRANIEMALYKHGVETRELVRSAVDAADFEQRRIGQELHDGIQQELAGLGMLAQTLLLNLNQNAGEQTTIGTLRSDELAIKIIDGIARSQKELRAIARGLSPVRTDACGLMESLRELAARTDDLDGVSCCFTCEQPVEVAKSLAAAHLYRIAQESITNALKHARPERISITLELDDGQPVLQISDDGIGFDPNTNVKEGTGLKIMQYRASLIGARVMVQAREDGGTLVSCRILNSGDADIDDLQKFQSAMMTTR